MPNMHKRRQQKAIRDRRKAGYAWGTGTPAPHQGRIGSQIIKAKPAKR